MTNRLYWQSRIDTCDVCGDKIEDEFYDMATKQGPWACMCPDCATNGIGINRLGLGLGQHYKREEVGGKYFKIAG
jgi:hypothetical protein